MELVQMLTSQLGVQEQQAQGGAGLLFQLAKSKLGDNEFAKVAQLVPGVGDMMQMAPNTNTGVAGALGGLASAVGGSNLGNLASLAGGFTELGLNPAMVNQFVPIVTSYVQTKGGAEVGGLLAQILK
ncbi:MAG: DUF2780 domain-containing protein [Microcoleaceae cyanobacterium]